MEKDRKARFVAIIALLVGVIGLSIGFAALSNTLTISSSAEVTVDSSTFNVDFSSSSSGSTASTSPVTPTLTPSNGPAAFTATNGSINNSGASSAAITNLHVTFTEPGQKATYTFYTKNVGALQAYLTNVTFASPVKTCTAKTGTTQTLVDSACAGISLKLTLGSEVFTASTARAAFATATAHDLAVGANETVTVEIEYASGSAQADGDFDVAFGDITLSYSSVV